MSARAGSELRSGKGTVVFYTAVEISDFALHTMGPDMVDTMIAIEVEEAAQSLYAEIRKWAK